LHTPGFNQRVVVEVLKNDFLLRHVPGIRALYKSQRDAMMDALEQHMAGLDVQWTQPQGGMFVWLRLPEGLDAQTLLPQAVEAGMAYVPGAPFYAHEPDRRTLRLSFVTSTTAQIEQGMAALARVVRQAVS
ncbi:MAG: aminotransferase class I/II-fold pyridoxal phosphate-dependent enzyme, partial [Ottowia sp.]|nr:aminotransferase class I/II-fold pyridoxal phosphate-dependent enzyme [Ottowia sp.]